jgi:hypothetical protein
LGPADFAWLDAQRTAHFPADRNVLPAHLTLFHHLPPSACDELLRLLKGEVRGMAPVARITGLISLGRGVAYRVASDGLEVIRDRIAAALKGQLTPQDNAPWRPHVTIQNKVPLHDARALHEALAPDFRRRPLTIAGLAAFYYRDGPWEPIADYRFNRSVRSPRN